ncbi:MAG: type III-B CRISPR module RAMP protein Cmr1 [Candidatus Korarchaeum sp.]
MRVSVTLSTISPVSWGGAEGADPLVVRIPSIRGSLRRWYRWYLASVSKPDPEEIRRRENEVFGTVHEGISEKDRKGAKRSSVKIQFGSLKYEGLWMGKDEPFLWPLRKQRRTFYTLDFELIMEGKPKYLIEVVKALSLNLSLSGFGYRSNRGYGSFRISFNERDLREFGEVFDLLEITKEITNAPTAISWENSLKKLLKKLKVRKLSTPELYEIHNLSNCYIVSRGGYADWKKALSDLERRLRDAERGLRIGRGNNVDYRVLLGSPILDPFRRRKKFWKERRSSPLAIGAGKGYIRGVLFLSKDYPESVLDHFKGKDLLECFDRVREELERVGLDVQWVGDLL